MLLLLQKRTCWNLDVRMAAVALNQLPIELTCLALSIPAGKAAMWAAGV